MREVLEPKLCAPILAAGMPVGEGPFSCTMRHAVHDQARFHAILVALDARVHDFGPRAPVRATPQANAAAPSALSVMRLLGYFAIQLGAAPSERAICHQSWW